MLNFYLFKLKLSKFIYLNSIAQWFATLMLAILITLSSPTWAALQAELQEGAIKVTNDQALEKVAVYLVWFDINVDPIKDSALSWQFEQDWQPGIVPVFSQPIDLPAFEAYTIQFKQPACPTDHGCLLAFVVTKPNQDPLDTQSWLDSVVIPLSASASCERLPGQKSFLSCSDSSDRNVSTTADKTTAAPTVGESLTAADGAQPAETEKPDIFKLVGNKILYANSAAQKFQVIDISDLKNPKLVGKFALSGTPVELYVRDNFYVLLQNDYSQPQGENNTRLTVLRQELDGKLTLLQDLTLPGYFSESRRRNEVIYVVTQQTTYVDCPTIETVPCNDTKEGTACTTTTPACISYQNTVNITAFRWNENGQLSEVDKDSLPGYSPIIAIFPDYLVIANHNPEEQNWQTTQIQVFDLSQSSDSLVKTCLFKVPGQVPSEFHLNVDKYLQVVYGPENRETGSTLAIYDLSTCSKDPVGQVGNIAPGENLFGTRFAKDRAFVITAVQKDPLWVIDISNPQEPKIMGELEVPGFSQKLFFHEDRLLAVGIDQPLPDQPTDKWWSRVALSLFNVSNPTQPTLIKRVVPLADQVSYDYSQALYDERVLLLDWEEEKVAALPIDSWETGAKSILQIVSLDNDNLTDVGYVDSPVSLQRAAVIDKNKLAALGDQILLTLSWGLPPVKPEVLGKLELATSLNWLKYQDGKLWAGVSGNNGYYRICRYNPTDLENPAKCLDLSKGYNNLAMDEQSIVAYDYSPLAIQALDTTNEQLGAAQVLEKLNTTETKPVDTASSSPPVDMIMPVWYQRYALVHDKQFCVAEQQPVKLDPQPQENLPMQWLLRCWNLSNAQEVTARSIPGQPIGPGTFTTNSELITREDMANGQIRLNRVALENDQAKLLFSQELPCYSSSNSLGTGEYIYMNCAEEQQYPGPVFIDQPAAVVKEDGGEVTASETVESNTVATEAGSTENTTTEVQPAPDPTTLILKLNPGQNFAEECRWILTGNRNLLATTTDTIVVGPSWGWWRYPTLLDAKMMPTFAPQEQQCEVYRLICGQEPQLLKQLETCPSSDTLALTPDSAWTAEGFAGIKEIKW
ncbi:secreted protein containing C-terminal beta-propeller domain [Thioploca ingrica]|uniref:Secreted protein containing C-terminal beta-propeller domain n=1 Tax=Thioploca ingrica TaxID=40754 RepID=A0A090AFB1_9GAMM|nr:secreted protein containing C-terminal beta-propeller domain [Thioploca ingrica]